MEKKKCTRVKVLKKKIKTFRGFEIGRILDLIGKFGGRINKEAEIWICP